MRTVHYSDILRGSAALAGIAVEDLAPTEQTAFRTFHDRRLQFAYEIHRWPELCPIEQRWFRDFYDSTVSYAAGAEVFDPATQAYYQCLQANTGQALQIIQVLTLAGAPETSANGTFLRSNAVFYTNASTGWSLRFISGNWWLNDPANFNYYYSPTLTGQWKLGAAGMGPAPTGTGALILNAAYWAISQPSYAADLWLPDHTYTAGDWIQNPADLSFQQCITSHVSGGTLDATKFKPLVPFRRYVAYEQTGKTAIGDFLDAWDADPRLTTKTTPLPFLLGLDGAEFVTLNRGNLFVWLQYRTRRPELTGEPLDVTLSYAAGRQVYFADATGQGDFYTATAPTTAGQTPTTQPALWTVVALPYLFRQYLIQGGYADWLTADEQTDKAQILEASCTALLEAEADKLQRQSGQVRRLRFHS